MNDLFSPTFYRFRSDQVSPDNHHHVIQITTTSPSSTEAGNLSKFFSEVDSIKDELKELERLNHTLYDSHETSKTLHNAHAVKDLRSRMEVDVTLALSKAKLIKLRLEALDRSNHATRSLPGCGVGSYSDRTRSSVLSGLTKKLKHSMDSFNKLREKISSEYRETVQRRYYSVTGENPDDETVDLLICSGESETFLKKAIQQQGRASVLETIKELEERHDAVREMERNLKELHQLFLDMAVLVQSQGEQVDDIESHMARANSFVSRGVHHLEVVKNNQKNGRKWTCFGVILFLVIILVVLLLMLLRK